MTDVHNDALSDEDFDTILSDDIDFSGNIHFEKPLLVRGKLSGSLDGLGFPEGILLVDEGAAVSSGIRASRVIIRGKVTGDIETSGTLEITSTGRLNGNVKTQEVVMEAGCRFNGECVMYDAAEEKEARESGA